MSLGLRPVLRALASSFASSRAATGLPLACFASNFIAFAIASSRCSAARLLCGARTSLLKAFSTSGAT